MSKAREADLDRAYDLYRIGRVIGDDNRAEVWNKILEHIVQDFVADSATVALLDQARRELRIIGGIGHPVDLVGKTIMCGEGVMGWVANERRPVLLNEDASLDKRFSGLVTREQRPESSICWPLLVEGRVVGVLSVNRSRKAAPYTQEDLRRNSALVDVVSVVIDNARLHVEREDRIERLNREQEAQRKLVHELREAQEQILRCDRMASIGQLAAGVAHEINNPIGYVNSNLVTVSGYVTDLLELLDAYAAIEATMSDDCALRIKKLKEKLDWASVQADIRDIFEETSEGLERVMNIVKDLKSFCHVSHDRWERVDLHESINCTLNIVGHELKYKAEIVRDYGALPLVECVSSQLNQVFMNLLVNAAQSIKDRGTIAIRTRAEDDRWVSVAISDTGAGIASDDIGKIFEPLFTTKRRGEGSGLGLSVCAGIIKKHGGVIEVESVLGQGTTMTTRLPVLRHNGVALRDAESESQRRDPTLSGSGRQA